jgi:hypothetical protein
MIRRTLQKIGMGKKWDISIYGWNWIFGNRKTKYYNHKNLGKDCKST